MVEEGDSCFSLTEEALEKKTGFHLITLHPYTTRPSPQKVLIPFLPSLLGHFGPIFRLIYATTYKRGFQARFPPLTHDGSEDNSRGRIERGHFFPSG